MIEVSFQLTETLSQEKKEQEKTVLFHLWSEFLYI